MINTYKQTLTNAFILLSTLLCFVMPANALFVSPPKDPIPYIQEIFPEATQISDKQGEPLILVSHNMRQVFDLVDRIVIFRRGQICANLDIKNGDYTGEDVVAYITGAKTGPGVGCGQVRGLWAKFPVRF